MHFLIFRAVPYDVAAGHAVGGEENIVCVKAHGERNDIVLILEGLEHGRELVDGFRCGQAALVQPLPVDDRADPCSGFRQHREAEIVAAVGLVGFFNVGVFLHDRPQIGSVFGQIVVERYDDLVLDVGGGVGHDVGVEYQIGIVAAGDHEVVGLRLVSARSRLNPVHVYAGALFPFLIPGRVVRGGIDGGIADSRAHPDLQRHVGIDGVCDFFLGGSKAQAGERQQDA